MDLDAPFLELGGDDGGGAVLFQPEFGMGVQILPDGRQLVMVATDMIKRGHNVSFALPTHVRPAGIGAHPPGIARAGAS